jgi:predicted  nucleic acid-binding Zn-ribbon protein
MQKLIAHTDVLIDKARKLAAENVKLRQVNTQLEQEVKELKNLLEAGSQKNSELNNKIKIIKLAQNISSANPVDNGEVTELKRKINEYIREIDNCIAMLND